MAKKNESLSYLQKPIPPISRKAKYSKRSWSSLNMRQTVDSGMLSQEMNISTADAPYLVPSPREVKVDGEEAVLTGTAIGIYGFDDFFITVSVQEKTVYFKRFILNDNGGLSIEDASYDHTGNLTEETLLSQRSIIQFNVFGEKDDVLNNDYDRKVIIFPDKLSFNYGRSDSSTFELATIETEDLKVPNIKYATVHLSRVFGVDDGKVYASGFNDYTNWAVDTATEYNESNAWFSASQSNTKADGSFTGITTFQNHVVCFKQDFMHEVYNTKNPFRIQDIYAEGTIDNRTVCDVDGKLIFCSSDGVKIYTGGNPKLISQVLDIDIFKNAVAGTDGRNYYLYCRDQHNNERYLVYDTYYSLWSERKHVYNYDIIGFAKTSFGLYSLDKNGDIYRVDTDVYSGEKWSLSTDLITSDTCDLKMIDKIQLYCEVGYNSSSGITYADKSKVSIFIDYGDGIEPEKDESGKDKGTVKPGLPEDWYPDDEDDEDEDDESAVWNSGTSPGVRIARVKIRKKPSYGFKIRLEGKGYVRIMALELLIKQGGDSYV